MPRRLAGGERGNRVERIEEKVGTDLRLQKLEARGLERLLLQMRGQEGTEPLQRFRGGRRERSGGGLQNAQHPVLQPHQARGGVRAAGRAVAEEAAMIHHLALRQRLQIGVRLRAGKCKRVRRKDHEAGRNFQRCLHPIGQPRRGFCGDPTGKDALRFGDQRQHAIRGAGALRSPSVSRYSIDRMKT